MGVCFLLLINLCLEYCRHEITSSSEITHFFAHRTKFQISSEHRLNEQILPSMNSNSNSSTFVIPNAFAAVAKFAQSIKRDHKSEDHQVEFFGM